MLSTLFFPVLGLRLRGEHPSEDELPLTGQAQAETMPPLPTVNVEGFEP
ncbi:MAG TPA: hypothetical protein VIJ50_05870 [Solirubrobacteraceae bacterium]